MSPIRGRQYIDWMLSAWITRVSGTLPLRTWPWRFGLCLVCRRWQDRAICHDCRRDWRISGLRCLRCAIDLPGAHQENICSDCNDVGPEFDRTIAAVDYLGPWPGLVAQLKFRDGTSLARPFAQLMADAIMPRKGMVDLILPVPLSAQRLRERGYNQAWLLARELGRKLNLEARPDLLSRSLHTSRLMSLSAEARQAQIQSAFYVTPRHAAFIAGRHVALVDDVMTTGATLQACSQALLDAGARGVSAWVLARTPKPDRNTPN